MGRGVSSGGGQSSLGYLFGSGEEAPKPTAAAARNVRETPPQSSGEQIASSGAPQKNAAAPVVVAPAPPVAADATKQIPPGPAGVPAATKNNYFRADGQNCGNFLTDRPTTKVHSDNFCMGGMLNTWVSAPRWALTPWLVDCLEVDSPAKVPRVFPQDRPSEA